MMVAAELAGLVHAVFEFSAIALGVALYRAARKRSGLAAMSASGSFILMVGLLVGAAIGNKLVFAIERPDLMLAWLDGGPFRLGRSLVGGMLGGLVGIECAKALTGQRASTGDLMVVPLAVGIAWGRIGCFLAGLHDDTYGIATQLPWGVDFGDGVSRHPTQLYEIVVVVLLAWALHRRSFQVPGLAFKLFLSAFLLWRFFIDGYKPVPYAYVLGLSGIQWVCVAALAIYSPFVIRALAQWRRP